MISNTNNFQMLVSFISHFVGRGVFFISTIFLSRHLSDDIFAEFSYIHINVVNLTMVSCLGLGVISIKSLAGDGSEQYSLNRKQVIKLLVLQPILIFSFLITLVILKGQITIISISVLIGGMLYSWYHLSTSYYYGANDFIGLLTSSILFFVSFLIATLLIIIHNNVYVPYLIASLPPVLFFIWRIKSRENIDLFGVLKENIELQEYRRKLLDILPIIVKTIIYTLTILFVTRSLSKQQINEKELGIFAVGMQWFSLSVFFSSAFYKFYVRKFSETNEKNIIFSHMYRSISIAFASALLCLIIYIPFGKYLNLLYGDLLINSYITILIFVISAVLSSPLATFTAFQISTRQLKIQYFTGVLWAVIFLLVFLSFELKSAYSVAIGFSVSYGLLLIVNILNLKVFVKNKHINTSK